MDSDGRLQGLVTQGDLLRALQVDPEGKMSVLDAGSRSLVVAYPDERVFDAVTKMLENNIGRLPVVDRKNPQEMVGYINRANVMGSWRGHLEEESVREHGWLRNLKSLPENRREWRRRHRPSPVPLGRPASVDVEWRFELFRRCVFAERARTGRNSR